MQNRKRLFLIANPEITDAAVNLALEEYCFRNLDARNDYLILYINDTSVVIGAYQNPWEEINTEAIINKEVAVLRRISGGGAVFHDRGNVNFSFITDCQPNRLGDFKFFTRPVIKSLNRIGIRARHAHRNTIEVEGLKISGNAQFANTKRIFSHGTLLYKSDLGLLATMLNANIHCIQSKSVASVRREVGNIINFLEHPMALDAFIRAFLQGLSKEYGMIDQLKLSDTLWAGIRQLAEDKYRTWEWCFGCTPPFAVLENCAHGDNGYPLCVTVKKGRIHHLESDDPRVNREIVPLLGRQWIGARYHPGGMSPS